MKMTKDEAIQVLLSKPAIAPSNSERQKKLNEAIDMAIESLQTEQQTEEEMLREQCQAFIDIVNHTEKGENNAID